MSKEIKDLPESAIDRAIAHMKSGDLASPYPEEEAVVTELIELSRQCCPNQIFVLDGSPAAKKIAQYLMASCRIEDKASPIPDLNFMDFAKRTMGRAVGGVAFRRLQILQGFDSIFVPQELSAPEQQLESVLVMNNDWMRTIRANAQLTTVQNCANFVAVRNNGVVVYNNCPKLKPKMVSQVTRPEIIPSPPLPIRMRINILPDPMRRVFSAAFNYFIRNQDPQDAPAQNWPQNLPEQDHEERPGTSIRVTSATSLSGERIFSRDTPPSSAPLNSFDAAIEDLQNSTPLIRQVAEVLDPSPPPYSAENDPLVLRETIRAERMQRDFAAYVRTRPELSLSNLETKRPDEASQQPGNSPTTPFSPSTNNQKNKSEDKGSK